jgi:hypothetical protein
MRHVVTVDYSPEKAGVACFQALTIREKPDSVPKPKFNARKEREWQLNNMESLTFINPDLHGKPKTETPDVPHSCTNNSYAAYV